jgi:hypothetical protein
MFALSAPSRPAGRRLFAAASLMAALSFTAALMGCGDAGNGASNSRFASSDSAVSSGAVSAAVASAPPMVTAPGAPPSLMSAPDQSPIGTTREIAANRSNGAGDAGAVAARSTPVPAQNAGQGASTAMVIRSGSASVQVDSLEIALAALQRAALAFGGYVGNTSISLGENQTRMATIELKIPASRYDAAIAGLQPLGKVESVTSSAQDVGEEFVDLSARVANARRLEERLIALLENRTGRLQEALAVERELSRVREEIERVEGRARYLSARVAVSTLVVSLHERLPLVAANPGENILLDAVKEAWRNFVRFIAVLISSLGVLVPLGVIVGSALAAWKRWQRAQKPVRLGLPATSDAP